MARAPHKYHYLYKITNTKNNKYYIGMHSTSNLEDNYMGGGKRIRNSIRKHGAEVHRKEILEFFESREILAIAERRMVNEELIKDPLCMNLAIGGVGGSGCFTQEQLIKGAKITSEKVWKDPIFVEKIKKTASETMSNLWKDPEFAKKAKEAAGNSFRGKSHSEEFKNMMSNIMSDKQSGSKNSQFGKIWIYSMDLRKSKRIEMNELDSHIQMGWLKGRKMKF